MRLLRPDATESARHIEQPVVIGPAARATLKVDRHAGVGAGWIFPGKLRLDVGLENLSAGSAARISIRGAQ